MARRDLLVHALPRPVEPARASSAGTTVVAIGARPAGSSRSVEVSRSPKTVIATVRGIGVAVITSTCGGVVPPCAQRVALLDPEAVLLVDDDQAEIGEADALLDAARGCRRRCRRPRLGVEQGLAPRRRADATR